MYRIILVNASTDLDELRKALDKAHSLRIHVSDNTVEFKINGGIWSAPMGQLDPECQAAFGETRRQQNEMACCTSQFGQPCAHKREGF